MKSESGIIPKIAMTSLERQLEDQLIAKLQDLKYEYRADIRDRAALAERLIPWRLL